MATQRVATVFGGSGFIGKYVVQRLMARGYVVRIANRDRGTTKQPMADNQEAQIVPIYASLLNDRSVTRAVHGADVVVNLIGILSERRPGDFTRVHAEGAGRIARAAGAAGVRRMVHMSALGADPASPSLYARSKAAGEQSVRAAFPGAVVLRPSVVFGAEDKFFNRFGAMAKALPIMPVISGGTRFQPVYVGNVADAMIAGVERDDIAGRIFELGGPDIRTFRELLSWLLTETRRRRPMVEMPPQLARLQAWIGEMVPGKPFTRDQLLLLARDNVVSPGSLGLAELGIVPTPIELVVPDYLRRYRPIGGGQTNQAAVLSKRLSSIRPGILP